MLYLKYTLSLVYFMVSQGVDDLWKIRGWGESSLRGEIPYYVQIHFQVVLVSQAAKHCRVVGWTAVSWRRGGVQKAARSLRGVKKRDLVLRYTHGFWFEVSMSTVATKRRESRASSWPLPATQSRGTSQWRRARGEQEHNDVFFFSI